MTPTATALAHETAQETLEARVDALGLSQLIESPFNPRKTFNAVKLEELAQSIREKGVVEPIVVRAWSKHSDQFEIICGARRYRAAKLAGLTHILAVIRTFTDSQAIEVMAIENGQRDDVAPIEEAAGYKQLMLVDKTYTAAMIAAKIGRSEKYVWDRLRLLELVAEIRELLVTGEIGVEHAEVIAKLKPTEQRSLLKTRAYSGESGLFEPDHALAFDDNPQAKKRKPVSVRELKQHIAEHVRLDIKHAAAAAPLEFAESAKRVEEAAAQPGRGKKVIPITFSHYCPDGAKDPNERTYGATSWKKAVGKDGQPTCEHAVLGLVVAGEHYGESFHVCINRDKCVTHWKESVAAKEKAAKLRERGKTKQAAKVEKKSQQKTEQKWEIERKEREARGAAWGQIEAFIRADAAAQVKSVKALTAAHGKAILDQNAELGEKEIKKHLGASWFKTPAAALLVSSVTWFHFDTYNMKGSGFDEFVKHIAKPFGLDVKRLEAIRDKHQPKKDAAAPAKKSA